MALVAGSFLLFSSSAAADCPEGIDAARLTETLHLAEKSYTKLDVTGFQQGVEQATGELPCLTQPLGPLLAARYHRLRGLHLFVIRDEPQAITSFAASKNAEPGYEFPEEMVPAGHSIRGLYGTPVEPSYVDVPPPAHGMLTFDGTRSLQRPTAWPTLVQVLDRDGTVRSTSLVLPESGMPAYEVKPDRPIAAMAGLFGGAAAAAVGSAVLFGLANGAKNALEKPTPTEVRQDNPTADEAGAWAQGLASKNHVLFYGGIGLGLAAAGTTAAGIVISL